MKIHQKILSGVLSVLLSAEMVLPAFSAILETETPGQFLLTDAEGNTQIVDESWEEIYPSGTFAFSADQVRLMENGDTVNSITLYRLGGTEGRAEAYITLSPASAPIDADGTMSYANAAGTQDYRVSVELPWSIAQYQPLGGTPAPVMPSEYGIDPNPALVNPENNSYPYYIVGLDAADSYQWQVQESLSGDQGGDWLDVDGATDALFYVTTEYEFTYHAIRCMYTIDGVTYCTDTNWGEEYVPEAAEDVPEMPEDFVNDMTEQFYDVEFDGNEYDMYTFPVIFAEDEWEKTITFEAFDDDLSEATEVLILEITEAYGATLYDTAKVATVSIEDDEPEIPSQIGFAVSEIYANKADGTVRIPLERTTDGLQYVIGAVYSVQDGTALAGTDYSAHEASSTYFAADMAETYLDIDLIDNGVPLTQDETGLYFTVTLTEVQGSAGSGILDGQDTVKVYLYNTSTEKPENGNIATELYSDEEEDASRTVTETLPLIEKKETIVVEAEEVPENAVGDYIPNVDGLARTHDYGALTFPGMAGNSSYWKDFTEIAYSGIWSGYAEIPYDTTVIQGLYNTIRGDMDTHEGYSTSLDRWTFNNVNEDDHGVRGTRGRYYAAQKGGYMELKFDIPSGFQLNDQYDLLAILTRVQSQSGGNAFDRDGSDVILLRSSRANDMKVLVTHEGGKTKTAAYWFEFDSDDLETTDRIRFESSYDGNDSIAYEGRSWAQLDWSYLRRRMMPAPNVVIHTADDDLIRNSSFTELHDTIKPVISMVAGEGGVADNGNFYVGSRIEVSRGLNASSYQFAAKANGGLDGAVFFSNADRSKTYKSATPKDNKATLDLLLPKEDSGNGGAINVVMDRVQNLAVQIAPSVERLEGSTSINPEKIGDAWNIFLQRSGGENSNAAPQITYTYSAADFNFTNGDDGFELREDRALADGSTNPFTNGGENGSTLYTAQDLKNVREINFNLPEDDLIVFNGRSYKGNETIEIPVELYTSNTLVFYYYHKDYVSAINDMVATITKIERYLDVDDGGADKGTVTDGDITLESLNDGSYTITDLTPRLGADNNYHQVVLKVFYTMLPKCLVLPEGAADSDRAEIIPALVTSQTGSALAKLTDEQKGYRYIDHKGTGSGKIMYGADATKESTVDLPLGGDLAPAEFDEDSQTFTWEPEWQGNSYYDGQFADAEPIYIDATVSGDRYPVGEVNASGELTSDGAKVVEEYLTSIQENDTFSICVRESVTNSSQEPQTRMRAVPEDTVITGLESATLAGVKTYPSADSARNMTDPENSKDADFDSSAADAPLPEFNMSGQQTLPKLDIGLTDYVTIAMDGQNLSFTIGMPLGSISKSTKITDQEDRPWEPAEKNGTRAANSDSIDMVKSVFQTIKNKGTTPSGTDSPKEQIAKSFNSYLDDLADGRDSSLHRDKNNSRGSFGIKVAGVEGSLGLSISIVLKWNPLEARFHFNQMLVALAGSVQFSYTAYLTPCPIVYVSITVGAGVKLSLGLEASRVKVIAEEFKLFPATEDMPWIDGSIVSPDKDISENGAKGSILTLENASSDWQYLSNAEKLGGEEAVQAQNGDIWVGKPGAQFTLTTKEKALDIHFNGKLYVEAKDEDGNAPEGFTPGTISSEGEEDEQATIKLAKKVDGKQNSKEYTVTFTVLDDNRKKDVIYNEFDALGTLSSKKTIVFKQGEALIDRVMTLEKNTSDVYFAGITISPELFFELCVGLGVEMFSVELFLQVSIGCAFAIAAHDSEDYADEGDKTLGFAFNEFSFAAALGFRVTALFFNFEFEAVKFLISYDREAKYDEQSQNKKGWNFFWYAANKQQGGGSLEKKALTEEPENPLTIRVILPGEGPKDETIYSPEDNLTVMNPLTRAYSAPDVPFEFSGYSDSGHAFPLEETLLSGSTYKLVTAGGANYLVYTITDGTSINATQLVISKVQETARLDDDGNVIQINGENQSAYGLVSLDSSKLPYTKLDNDAYGDLEFDAWVDGDDIRVAWVSYTDKALEAYKAQLDPNGDSNMEDSDEIKKLAAIKALAAAGKNTVVKSAAITIGTDADTGEATYTIGTPETVSDNKDGHGMYYAPSGAGNLIYYSEAQYYGEHYDEETNQIVYELPKYLDDVKSYLGGDPEKPATDSGYRYGDSDPTVDFQMYYRRLRAEVYGKTSYPTYALRQSDGTYTITALKSDEWATNQVQLENVAITQIGNDYYAAYNTAYSEIVTVNETLEEQTYRKLYLQKLTVGENGTLTVGKPVVIRSLVDQTGENSVDGVYVETTLKEAYDDPYFANINFLTGKLGDLSGTSENFTETLTLNPRARNTGDASTFLIFEMNAETYVVPQRSLESITAETDTRTGEVIPFFTKETAEELTKAHQAALAAGTADHTVESAPAVTNVTFGVDGNGNVTAVYTQPVRGTSSNALYMTKFDSSAKTWGAGTMLAMHRMSVYEDSVAYDWTLEETEAAFYAPDDNDEIQNFNFSKSSIGFAGEDQLLVITEGTLANLTASTAMEPVRDANNYYNLLGIQEQKDEDGNPVQVYEMALTEEGVYDTQNGIYALTFGVGERALGYAALHLSNYDFTPGSTMNASVSFTNIGDTTIRASENEPVTIRLMMDYPDGNSGVHTEPITGGQWLVTESIAAGQEVDTFSAEVTLPTVNITDGAQESNPFAGGKIYFTVEEDGKYVSETGGTAFHASTKTEDSEPDTAACITIEDQVEMGYEHFEISMADASDDDVTLYTNIHVGNRGTKDSENTYLRFQYVMEDANGTLTYYPLPLTGHKLSVSEQAPLTRNLSQYTLENGYLPLRTTEDGVPVSPDGETNIDSMHGRTVTGTFTVDKDCYDTDTDTGSLNLVVTIVSVDDNGTENEEYDILGNIREVSIEPETLFEAPAKLSMQVGSTFRMPIDIRTSTITDPMITVTELTEDSERNLSVLYYDTTHSAIVIMPGLEGEGIIRVADTGTGSCFDICYSVKGEGEAINIFNDNEIFEWYVPDADGKLTEDDPDDPAWEFEDERYQFAGGLETMPYRSDLAIGEEGYAIQFRTLADTIELFFMGNSTSETAEITVTSDLAGFEKTVTLTSNNGTVGQKVEFHNAASIAHTVTITVKDGPVQFDKMYETFAESLTISSDPTAPVITFSRTLPEAASVDQGERVPLKVYFADIGGLASAAIDGNTITAVQESESLWSYDLTDVFTENGSHWIMATDTAGNVTEKEVNVEWFSATAVDGADKDPGAVQLHAVLVDKNGNPFEDFDSAADAEADFLITDGTGENAVPITDIGKLSVSRLEYLYDEDGNPTRQYMQTYELKDSDSDRGLYKVPSTDTGLVLSGIYKITYSNDSGILSECFVFMDDFDVTAPEIEGLTINEEDGTITIHISKTPNTAEDGRIVEVRINDWEPIEGEFGNDGYSFSSEIPIPDRNGKYTLIVTDENGHVTKQEFEINLEDQNDFDVPDDIVEVTQMVSKDEDGDYKDNGEVIVKVDEITGGHYDPETSTGLDDLNPKYEVAIVPAGEEPDEDDWVTVTTVTTPENVIFDDLAIGEYEVYIRDANNPDTFFIREVELHQHEVEITSVESENSVNDADSGWIIVENIGGLGDTESCLTDTDGNIVHDWQDDGKFENLPAGNYIVVIRDKANRETNLTSSSPIEIKQLYTVEIAVDQNGHAELNGDIEEGLLIFDEGKRLVITAVPDTGYRVDSIIVNGKEVKDPEAPYIIESLDQPYEIAIFFRYGFSEVLHALDYYETIGKYKVRHYITAEAGTGGSISPEGKTTVYYGDSVTYTITPDDGYEIDRLLVNGKRVPASESYTFDEITGSETIKVTFRETEPAEIPAEPIPETTDVWQNPFTDISETAPYYDAVRYVFENGYMNGVSDSKFAPDTTLTRAMLVTILWRMAGCPAIDFLRDFTDVPQDTWYTEAVRWAAGCELVLGYGDGTFGPDDTITVEQLAVILYRYIQRTGGGFTDASQWMYDLPYADAADIADWAKEAMYWYVENDIYTGTGGYLNPQEFASRALAAQMLYAMSIQ